MKHLIQSTALLTLLLSSAIASAQTAPVATPHGANANHAGGKAAHMMARWQAADTDKDGQLSRAEVQAANMPRLAKHFDAIDTNKDGKLSPAEMQAWRQKHHAMRHGHGMPAGQSATAPFGRAPNNTAMAAHPTPEQRMAAMKARFEKADLNKDGALTLAEAQNAGMLRIVNRFDQIDANKDGKVTLDEIRAAWQRKHKP